MADGKLAPFVFCASLKGNIVDLGFNPSRGVALMVNKISNSSISRPPPPSLSGGWSTFPATQHAKSSYKEFYLAIKVAPDGIHRH